MTALIEHLTGRTAEPEAPVTTPRPFTPAVPWWGVHGLDPAIEVDDWATAARYTALACAVWVSGIDAAYRTTLFSPKGKPAVDRMRSWLLQAVEPEGAARRRFALRLACEQARHLEVEELLQVADAFYDALTLR